MAKNSEPLDDVRFEMAKANSVKVSVGDDDQVDDRENSHRNSNNTELAAAPSDGHGLQIKHKTS